ncbi:MAG: hypothetical protein LUD19_06650 [Clostridia bacterium]|nr:hypothetical protein [Clostridia bacterium]
MAKKNKSNYKPKPKETNIEDFYDLKTKEMDELVAALKGEVDETTPVPTMNIAEITGEEDDVDEDGKHKKRPKKKKEFDPYKRDKLSRIPKWLSASFIKFWFFGVVCYFVFMAIGALFVDDSGDLSDAATLDLYFICGVVMGIIVDCMVNPIFRMMESDKKEFNNYMMFPFPFKQFWTILTNIIYYLVVVFFVGAMYYLLDVIGIYAGVEPLLFGVFCLIVDMIFIGIKDLIVFLIKKLIKKVKEKKVSEVENA